MRFRLTTRPAVLFGAMLALALVAFLPLRIALGIVRLGDTGFTAREAHGSIWSGELRVARFGDLDLGDLSAHLSPWPLLVGRARVALASRADAPNALTGAIAISRHGLGLDDVTATLPTGNLFAPLPVSALDLDDVTVRFRDQACESADGRVRTTLAGGVGGVTLGQTLSGTARCDGDALLLPLTSPAGDAAEVRLWVDGRYVAALTLHPPDASAAQRLEAAGFAPGPAGHRLSIAGHL